MAEEAAGGAAPAKSKGKLIKMLAMAGIAIALVGGGAFAGKMFLGGSSKAAEPAAEGKGEEIAGDAGASEEGGEAAAAEGGEHGEGGEGAAPAKAAGPVDLFVPFETLTTNLADPKGRDYVVAKINLKAANAKMLEVINQNMIPLRAATLQMLASKTREDVSTVAGQTRFNSDLKARYKAIVPADAITDVYITDFRLYKQ